MLRPLAFAAVAATLFASGPAMARENCNLNDNTPGLKIEFGFSFGGIDGKDGYDSDGFDPDLAMIELRRRGVNPRSVSLASDGCVEAFVQYPDGTWHSDYYDPDTWRQVD